MRNFLLTN